MLKFPKQRLSYEEKSKNDFEWGKETLNYLCRYAMENNGYYYNINEEYHHKQYLTDYNRKLTNYQLYNNIINQKDFEKECNPLGLEVGQFKDEIKPYNKSYNKIQVLLGEELKRPFNFRCAIINSDGIKEKEVIKNHKIKHWIENQVQQYMQKLQAEFHGNVPPEELQQHIQQESESLIPPQEIEKWYSTKYQDKLEIAGSKIMKYLIRTLNIKDKKNDAFKHALISGDEVIWIGAKNGEPVIEVLNPLNVFYHKSPETKYIQKGLYAGYKQYMTISDILDTYEEFLSEKDLHTLESRAFSSGGGDYNNGFTKEATFGHDSADDFSSRARHSLYGSVKEGSYGNDFKHDLLVTHVEWKSQRKVGFITFTDEYGENITEIVDESFAAPKYAKREMIKTKTYYTWKDPFSQQVFSLEWKWLPEIWEGVKIGHDIYCCIGPKQYQNFSIDHPYESSLGYYGAAYNSMNAPNVSLMDRMKPFLYLYLIVVHKLKTLIARDKGKLFHFDVSMIPKELGLEKTLYYLQEMDIDFYNPLMNAESPGSYQRGKVTSATDRSNMQHILNYINLMNAIDAQISDVAGITKQREGMTSNSQAVTNAQSDLIQSSTVTEIYFAMHNKIWEDALNELLNVALKCYKENNKLIQYMVDDMSLETINMMDVNVTNKELGLFVTDSIKENTVFTRLQEWGQALIQNDKANVTHLISILQADSVAELKQDMISFEKEQQAQLGQQAKLQADAQKELALFNRETQVILKDKDYERAIDTAKIDVFKFQQDLDQDNDGTYDFLEVEKFNHQKMIDTKKLDLEKEKIQVDKQKVNKMGAKK